MATPTLSVWCATHRFRVLSTVLFRCCFFKLENIFSVLYLKLVQPLYAHLNSIFEVSYSLKSM